MVAGGRAADGGWPYLSIRVEICRGVTRKLARLHHEWPGFCPKIINDGVVAGQKNSALAAILLALQDCRGIDLRARCLSQTDCTGCIQDSLIIRAFTGWKAIFQDWLHFPMVLDCCRRERFKSTSYSWQIWWKEEEDPTPGRLPPFRFRVSSAGFFPLACKPSITLSFAHTNENYLYTLKT